MLAFSGSDWLFIFRFGRVADGTELHRASVPGLLAICMDGSVVVTAEVAAMVVSRVSCFNL